MSEIKLQPLHSRVIVRLEGTTGNKLSEYVTDGGIVIAGGELSSGRNAHDGLKDRWAEVIAVGPECTLVRKGDRVLIDQGKWTEAIKLSVGNYVWMTEEEHISLVDDEFFESNGKNKTNAIVI